MMVFVSFAAKNNEKDTLPIFRAERPGARVPRQGVGNAVPERPRPLLLPLQGTQKDEVTKWAQCRSSNITKIEKKGENGND